MDRSAFLNALPCLQPIKPCNDTAKLSWPPQDEETNVTAVSIPIVLPETESLSLSIEPTYSILGYDNLSTGPAFFQCSTSISIKNNGNGNGNNDANDSITPTITNNKSNLDDDDDDKEYSNSNSITDASDNMTKKDIDKTKINSDPAICDVEMAYIPWEKIYKKEIAQQSQHISFGISPRKGHNSNIMSPGLSAISNNSSYTYSLHNTPSKYVPEQHQQQQQQQQQQQPKLYIRLNKSMQYSIDYTQIIDITLDEPQKDAPTKPSSLILRFEECTFRLFFFDASKHLQLQKVYMILLHWLNYESSMEFLESKNNSPTRNENSGSSSSTSLHEPGQRCDDNVMQLKEKHAISPSSKRKSNNVDAEEDALTQHANKKRKLQHQKESWEAMQAIFSNTNIISKEQMAEDDMHALLTTCATNYAESYCTDDDNEEYYRKKSSDKLSTLEKTMHKIFPTPNKTKLQLKATSSSQQQQQLCNGEKEGKAKKEIININDLEKLIKDCKNMIDVRHDLSSLPKR